MEKMCFKVMDKPNIAEFNNRFVPKECALCLYKRGPSCIKCTYYQIKDDDGSTVDLTFEKM